MPVAATKPPIVFAPNPPVVVEFLPKTEDPVEPNPLAGEFPKLPVPNPDDIPDG